MVLRTQGDIREISNNRFNKSTHLEFPKSIRYVVPAKKMHFVHFFRCTDFIETTEIHATI